MLFILLLSYCTLIYPQDYIAKYSLYLPQIVIENPGIRNGINESIAQSASVNPFLISDELNFANNFFVKKLLKPDQNGRDYIRKLRSYYQLIKSQWADSIYQLIKNDDFHFKGKFKIDTDFENSYEENLITPEEVSVKIPSNFDYYFVYSFLNGNILAEYDSSKNYLQLVQNVAANITRELDKEAEYFPKMPEGEQSEFIDKIIALNYLLTDSRFNTKINFSIKDIITAAYNQNYRSRSRISLNGIYNIGNWYKFKVSTVYSYYYQIAPGYNRTWNLPFESEMIPKFFIGANYSLSIKEYIGWFNYVKFGVQYIKTSNVNSPNQAKKFLTSWTYRAEPNGYYEKYYYNVAVEISSSLINWYVAVPVYYFRRNLFTEIGISLIHRSVSASNSVIVDDVYINSQRTILSQQVNKKTVDWKETELSFIPSLYYRPLPYIDISLQGIVSGKMIGLLIGTQLGIDL